MEQELLNTFDKELLLKDLCARLPYRVKVRGVFLNYNKDKGKILYEECDKEFNYEHLSRYETLKPYLFPLSSMTEEQKMFLKQQNWRIAICTSGTIETTIEGIDWLNKNHFDYRNLIDKNLAIDCTNLNIY